MCVILTGNMDALAIHLQNRYFHRAFKSQITSKLELINLTYGPFNCNLVYT